MGIRCKWIRKGIIVDHKEIIAKLNGMADAKNLEGMTRFGINPNGTLGISIPKLREMAKNIGKDHELALKLWESRIHEARLLASFIDDYKLVTDEQMEKWVMDFDSWDVCDQVCGNLFDKTEMAYDKTKQWADREEEYVRRAGFVMMATLSIHDKNATDDKFMPFFDLMKLYAHDERNFVMKAINWALRQVGKRNDNLKTLAINCAEELIQYDKQSAKWIARDALRELREK